MVCKYIYLHFLIASYQSRSELTHSAFISQGVYAYIYYIYYIYIYLYVSMYAHLYVRLCIKTVNENKLYVNMHLIPINISFKSFSAGVVNI